MSASPTRGRAVELAVDLEAVVHNARAIQAALSSGCRLYACLKGDAYGIGIRLVAPALASAGISAFAVGAVEDALEIRRAGCSAQEILLYPNCMPDAAPLVQRERLTITISSVEEAQAWNAAASGAIDAFVKIDVGAIRAGVLPRQAGELARALLQLSMLRVVGAYAHFHLPQPAAMHESARWQFANFQRGVTALANGGLRIPVRMVAGTAALLEFPDMDLEAVDPGRALFGLGFENVQRHIPLRPALVGWRARLMVVKEIEPDDSNPHGAPFPLRPRQRVGVIPVGWGDGLPRKLPDSAVVLVRGKRVRLLPPSHFEHVRVDLTDVPEACYGDEVVMLGVQRDARVTLDELGKWMDRDPLHLLGAMPRHLSREPMQPDAMVRQRVGNNGDNRE